MPQLDRLEPQSGRGQERTVIVEPDQPGLLELAEARVGGQHLPMRFVTVEHHAAPRHFRERLRVDMIAVGVRQDGGRDPRPGRADALEPLADRPGPDARRRSTARRLGPRTNVEFPRDPLASTAN